MSGWKRRCAAVACALLVAGTLTSCAGLQPKPKVTLTIKVPPLAMSSSAMPDLQDAYDLLERAGKEFAEQYTEADVTVNVVKFDYVAEDQFITDCFDTEDAADILFENYFNMSTYVYTGRVVPLDDIITDAQRADIGETYWDMSRMDGKTYMLPYYATQHTLGYNKELFRQCGLEEYIGEENTIQSWTPEEWETILSTLAARLPEMHYPMMMYARNEQGDTHIMTLLRSRGCTFFDEEGRFCLNTPEGIAALQWFVDARQKGYFPANCESLMFSDCVDLFQNGQLAISMVNSVMLSSISNIDIGLVNFPSMDGRGYNTRFLTGFMAFDNGDTAKLAAAKAFLQFFYASELYMDCSQCVFPVSESVLARMGTRKPMSDAYRANVVNAVDFRGGNPNWRGVRSVFWPEIHALLSGEQTAEEAAAAIDRACNEAIDVGWKSSTLHE